MNTNTDRPMLQVHGGTTGARPFNVRVVRFGECYGTNDCLTHTHVAKTPDRWDGRTTRRDVLVEFYDGDSDPVFGPRGQFVSRYTLNTLRGSTEGINLHGGVSEWTIPATAVRQATAYAEGIVAALGDGATDVAC